MSETSSHQYFAIMSYKSFALEEINILANTCHKMFFVDSPTIMIISEEYCCLSNQPRENFNQSNDVNVYHPNINNFGYKMKDDNFFTSFDPFNSLVVDYLKHVFKETHQEHETIQFQLMVMSDSHFLTRLFETNHIKYLSHDIPLNNFTHDPHSYVNFFQSHCIYHDRIEIWLEKYFHERFPLNSNLLIMYMLNLDLDISILFL